MRIVRRMPPTRIVCRPFRPSRSSPAATNSSTTAAAAGDCAVYDKTAGAIRFVKGETLSAAQLPESLTPLAVVYARQGDKVLIVSLDNVASELRWAASYEVALSGFDLATGGTIVLRIGSETEVSITYAAGGTLAS